MRAIVTSAAVIVLAACMGAPGGGGSEAGRGGRFGPPGGGLEPTQPPYINPGTPAALPRVTHAVRPRSNPYRSGQGAPDPTGQIRGPRRPPPQAPATFRHPPLC